ncbi:aminotransferase class I/II-fold pyridoxal phosphate-dependent enzyme [Pedobacter sp. BS3]|uniref:methionine aminotransferase n=1 Tax=Pedobacter sp. BS3 TaxID=2567937 RepID=UPI0011EF80DB|nr:methionine aminotransferase [Pedobacter sp. BS3]TZF84686.1 aminotransferase class I/II-fold pyridoxal phosphate-dependent enzyme [Pedobacter sp. BS3]
MANSFISKLPQVKTTIFTTMSQLAAQHQAINLSQGFPDYDCDPELVSLVNRYMQQGHNQYAPMPGVMTLRERISEKIQQQHQAYYHPESEITITAGGTQALFTAMAAVIKPNDEVIIFEPAYDSYAPTIKLFGGIVKAFQLSPPDFKIDWTMVKKLFSPHTRMIIINSPNNPTGAILTEEDIRELIAMTRNTDILILSDEVYEHLIYDGRQHLSMARYPELRERSFITASFGKLFHTTGWKTGYVLAPKALTTEFRKVHQFLVFSVNTPVQYALADYMRNTSRYHELIAFFQHKRDYFAGLLTNTRFKLLKSYGSYFQLVTYKGISTESEIEFARRLTIEHGVAAIPVSAFYAKETNHQLLRFCFAKKQETLENAVKKLEKI